MLVNLQTALCWQGSRLVLTSFTPHWLADLGAASRLSMQRDETASNHWSPPRSPAAISGRHLNLQILTGFGVLSFELPPGFTQGRLLVWILPHFIWHSTATGQTFYAMTWLWENVAWRCHINNFLPLFRLDATTISLFETSIGFSFLKPTTRLSDVVWWSAAAFL